MRKVTFNSVVGVFLGLCLMISGPVAKAADNPPPTGSTAEITQLIGQAFLVDPTGAQERSLETGDFLKAGDQVQVGPDSRLELRLPDNSYVRFNGNSRLSLTSLLVDSQKQQRNIKVKVVFGQIWATVSKLFSSNENFVIETNTAVAGVRGTTYRLDVNRDNSAVVKVYEGKVDVKSAAAPTTPSPDTPASAAPRSVAGPRAVAGPHPVSLDEWVYIVRAMHQLVINADGSATKPFRFSYKADLNDWVQWNRQRDAAVQDSPATGEKTAPGDPGPNNPAPAGETP